MHWSRDLALILVFVSTKGMALLINDKEDDPNRQDDESNRPEDNAHLEVMVQDQQDDTKSNHAVPLFKAPIPASRRLYAYDKGLSRRI